MARHDDLLRRLEAVERSCRLTTELALLTDRDLQQEKSKRQIILHLRGECLDEVQKLFNDHLDKKGKDTGGKKPRVQPAAGGAVVTKQPSAQLWNWLLEALKKRASAATEAGRCQLAVQAVQGLYSVEGAAVLHSTHFHTREPVEDDRGRVWRASLDFAFLEHGTKALQAFAFELQAFSYGDFCYHRASVTVVAVVKDVTTVQLTTNATVVVTTLAVAETVITVRDDAECAKLGSRLMRGGASCAMSLGSLEFTTRALFFLLYFHFFFDKVEHFLSAEVLATTVAWNTPFHGRGATGSWMDRMFHFLAFHALSRATKSTAAAPRGAELLRLGAARGPGLLEASLATSTSKEVRHLGSRTGTCVESVVQSVAESSDDYCFEGAKQGNDVVCSLSSVKLWCIPMKVWQKLTHALYGNSVAANTAAVSPDPWSAYLANTKQPAKRAKWEDGLTLEAGQLVQGSTEPKQIATGAVTCDATGIAFCTLKSLESLSQVRSTKALAVLLPGCQHSQSLFDGFGINAGATIKGMVRVHDEVSKVIELKGVTVVNLGAEPVTFAKLEPKLKVPTDPTAIIVAEIDSRYMNPELKQSVQRNVRAAMQTHVIQMMPDEVHLSHFDFFGWFKRGQGEKVVHGVKFLVPAKSLESVLAKSGMIQPVFFRHFIETGNNPVPNFSLQWQRGQSYAEVKKLASSTQGVMGIILSSGGLGVRVRADAVSEVRRIVAPEAPSFTSDNRGVIVREHWQIAGVPRALRVEDLIKQLASWGWQLVPTKAWAMPGCPQLLVWLVGA
ncbi:unnamed protein product [Symbiodinium sp. CCMP2592]|nr:unnamed protein product [Symbiodinium sp. CCMP2592]